MAKSAAAIAREYKKALTATRRKAMQEYRAKLVSAAMAKATVDGPEDMLGIYYGLSQEALRRAAYLWIRELADLKYSPREIVEIMGSKWRRRNRG